MNIFPMDGERSLLAAVHIFVADFFFSKYQVIVCLFFRAA